MCRIKLKVFHNHTRLHIAARRQIERPFVFRRDVKFSGSIGRPQIHSEPGVQERVFDRHEERTVLVIRLYMTDRGEAVDFGVECTGREMLECFWKMHVPLLIECA